MECAICYETIAVGSGKKLGCDHVFHPTCIGTWIMRSRSCPMCRCAIPHENQTREADLTVDQVLQRCFRFLCEYSRATDRAEKDYKREIILRLVTRYHLEYDIRITDALEMYGIAIR